MSLANGVTIEAVVEIPAGRTIFYPRTPTHSVHGKFEGIDYTLSSLKTFTVDSAKSSSYTLYQLSRMDVE